MSSKVSDTDTDEMLAFSIFAAVGYAKDGMTHLDDWQQNIETRLSWRNRVPAFKEVFGKSGLRTAVSSSQMLKKGLDKLLILPPRPAYDITDEMESNQCQSSQEKPKD